MQHPYDVIERQNAGLISGAYILPTKRAAALKLAGDLLKNRARYAKVIGLTGVLIPVTASIHEREASADFRCCMANGERIINTGRKTTLVPRGRGPYDDPSGWEKSVQDAYHIDGLDKVAALHKWTMESAAYYTNAYNGWGPNDHGKHSGYLWSWTNVYDGGKYVSDGKWNPNFWDPQPGCMAIIMAIAELAPELALPRALPTVTAPTIIPPPVRIPDGVGHPELTAAQVQAALNYLGCSPPLWTDGNYGRLTMRAVRSYEVARKLDVDAGYAGPQVRAALLKDLDAHGIKISDLDAKIAEFQKR